MVAWVRRNSNRRERGGKRQRGNSEGEETKRAEAERVRERGERKVRCMEGRNGKRVFGVWMGEKLGRELVCLGRNGNIAHALTHHVVIN